MTHWLEETESLVHKGRIKVPYTWWVGETGTDFFNAIKDDKTITGTFCPSCGRVFTPPRKNCGRCFTQGLERRELGSTGTLTTFTIPRRQTELSPREGLFAYGVVKLEGADVGLVHLIAEFDEGSLRSGMKVEAVFREDRRGEIRDIEYFRPVK
ncbi:MAG: Zn-ribbon domain-containing OB-fold protein [Pseudomonadota bacterium]